MPTGMRPGDDRIEKIAYAKHILMESTNIEGSPDEMAVIDSILFRMWQMGWLPEVPEEFKAKKLEIRWEVKRIPWGTALIETDFYNGKKDDEWLVCERLDKDYDMELEIKARKRILKDSNPAWTVKSEDTMSMTMEKETGKETYENS